MPRFHPMGPTPPKVDGTTPAASTPAPVAVSPLGTPPPASAPVDGAAVTPLAPELVKKPLGTTTAGHAGSALALQLATLKEANGGEVMKATAKSLTERAVALESRKGVGFEHFGTGDPDVVLRRSMVAQLDDAPADLQPKVMLSKAFAARDLKMHKRFERRDVQKPLTDAIKEAVGFLNHLGAKNAANAIQNKAKKGEIKSFNDLANEVNKAVAHGKRDQVDALYYALVLEDRMAQNAKVNTERATKGLAQLLSGEKAFFEVDAQRFSTAVLPMIEDPELRARTLVDVLLQFREPIAKNVTKEKDTAGGAGVQSVHEMRAYAARIDPSFGDATAEREFGLARAVVNANPVSSSNAVLEARHLVGKLRRMSWELVYGEQATPPGMSNTPYKAIHHNFSIETPRIIEAFTRDVVFGGGDPQTFCRLSDALGFLTSGKQPAEGERLLKAALNADPQIRDAYAAYAASNPGNLTPAKHLEGFLVSRCKGKLDSGGVAQGGLSADDKKHLLSGNISTTKGQYPEKLALVARLYRTLCESLPSAATLQESLFSSLGAAPKVAEAIAHLQTPDAPLVATLQSLTDARAAVRSELATQTGGHRRIELMRVDKQLEALTSTHLGALVDKIGDIKTDADKVDALAGMKLALESARLSGLDAIKDLNDPKALKGPQLAAVAAEIDALFAAGSVDLGTYQATMARAYEAIVRTTENVRAFVDRRVPDVSDGSLVPNPSFMDDLVKEGPLHYARAIGQKALRVGLEAEMSAKKIINPDGVAVLNPLGRVVFDRVMMADSMSDLQELGAGRGDMCWVRKMDEKKMMAVGGIMSDFPGGYCHAAVYARGAGIAALSNPDISAQWMEFAANLKGDKLYYDDTGGRIVMMPLSEAVKQGVVKPGEAERLKPGTNREVKYYEWSEALKRYETVGQHKVVVDLERSTDVVELYNTSTPIAGQGAKCMSFEDIGKMGTAARALFGEKSLVLSLMSQNPVLKDYVPPGSAISTLRVQQLLGDAGVLDKWVGLWDHDPEVGKLTDANFLESKFYTDGDYRKAKREEMSVAVKQGVGALLLDASGQPTAKGKELLDELRANAKLAACDNWIVRSSFTAEDRPGKSGAGQYDSFPNCKSDREILEGVVGVIASAWEAPPVENNVREEYNLSRIWPAITVMKCLDPEYSGVGVSRDTGTGHRRTASYQSVIGFGGGVEDGVTEQGKIREGGKNELANLIKGHDKPLVDEAMAAKLWTVSMEAERMFHQVVEPGRGLAVDMEWCVEKGQLYVVQARTIRA
jgi:hypothetical protein